MLPEQTKNRGKEKKTKKTKGIPLDKKSPLSKEHW